MGSVFGSPKECYNKSEIHLWPGGLLPFAVDPKMNANAVELILKTMEYIEEYTCIT
jgi:hypothetical protein